MQYAALWVSKNCFWFFCAFVSSHRARVKGKLRWELHAGREAKGVHVEHGVVRIQQLRHGAKALARAP
jgi:hypothetical protein